MENKDCSFFWRHSNYEKPDDITIYTTNIKIKLPKDILYSEYFDINNKIPKLIALQFYVKENDKNYKLLFKELNLKPKHERRDMKTHD